MVAIVLAHIYTIIQGQHTSVPTRISFLVAVVTMITLYPVLVFIQVSVVRTRAVVVNAR